jgi:hypothetical protein
VACSVESAPSSTVFIQSSMTISSGIKLILRLFIASTGGEVALLILLMGYIYDARS